MSSTAVSFHNNRQGRKDAQKQQHDAEERARLQQEQIDSDLGTVRAGFGMGEDVSEIDRLLAGNRERAGVMPGTVTRTVRSGGASYGRGLERGRSRTAPRTTTVTEANPDLAGVDAEMRDLNRRKGNAIEAQQSRSEMQGWIDEALGTGEAMAVTDLNDQAQGARLNNKRELSRRGLLGGSTDSQLRLRNSREYIGGRQKIVADRIQQGQAQASKLTDRRQQLEGLVRGGGLADISADTFRNEEGARIQQGLNNVVPQAMGDAFTTAGQVFETSQEAVGSRRKRVPMTTTTGRSSSGTGQTTKI